MKNLVKILAVVTVIGSLLVGCGGTKKPDGTYTNDEVSFNFGSDSVIVSEGDANVTCDYEMDSDGTITFELEGEEVTLTYDAEHDVVNYDDKAYTKMNTESDQYQNKSEKSSSDSTQNETDISSESNNNSTKNDGEAEKIFSEELENYSFYGMGDDWKEITISISDDSICFDTSSEFYDESGAVVNNNTGSYAEYHDLSFDGTTLTAQNDEEGEADFKMTYDAEKETLSDGTKIYFKNKKAFLDSLPSTSEVLLSGTYKFHASQIAGYSDGKDIYLNFINGTNSMKTSENAAEYKYLVMDGRIFIYDSESSNTYSGTYDSSIDKFIYEGALCQKTITPEGLYSRGSAEDGDIICLEFYGNTVTFGRVGKEDKTCVFEIDGDSNITIDYDGSAWTATYNAEDDTITMEGIKYTKIF